MSLFVYIPNANPLNFTEENYSPAPQYNSKHIHDYQYEETIRQWQYFGRWVQPWQQNDAIRIQLLSQLDPIEMTVYDSDDIPVFGMAFQQMQQSWFDPTIYIYQLDYSLSNLDPGFYKIKVDFGSPITLTVWSNLFEVREKFEDSLLIEYNHFKQYGDIYFQNGFRPSMRIIGTLVYDKPASKNAVFENQESDMTLIDTKPHDIYKLYTGGPEGIPDWAILKYNIIMGCSSVKIDGRYYTKASEGVNFEEAGEKNYILRGWSIDLRDKLNRRSKIWDFGGVGPGMNNLGLSVAVNVETKGFVNNDQGGSYYEIQDVE